MNHPEAVLIHDFVDDELTLEQRRQVTGHLADCADCRAVVASARKLKEEAARAFGDAAEPVPAQQWEGIEARIRAAGGPPIALPVREDRGARSGRRVAAAAAVVLLATAGVFAWRASRPAAAPVAQNVPATDALLVNVDTREPSVAIADAYAPVFAELERILAEQRDLLQPETVAAIEANLAIVNQAITDIQAALAADPANRGGIDALEGIYQAKLDILRSVATLAPQV